MARFIKLTALAVLCISTAAWSVSYADSRIPEGKKNIVVEIDYGNVAPARMVQVPLTENKTALEILQSVAAVETHPVGQHVFVTAIDKVKGKRGEMGWYYEIDGQSADKLAYSNVIDDSRHIKWVYKKDVCSEKVDGKKE